MIRCITLVSALFLVQISSAQQVILGTGTGISVFSPIDRHRDYSVYEVIYLQSAINMAGPISGLEVSRVDGSNTDSIENVRLYMKHTSATSLTNANYDTTGYSLVFTGSFPNDAGTGWRGVQLDSVFVYDNISNLQVLIVKDYQPAIANTPVTPRWYYTSTTVARARRYYGYNPITTSTPLTTTLYSSNVRLTFNNVSVVELIERGSFSVYPNPSRDIFNITIPLEITEISLSILNVRGEVVYENTSSGDQQFSTPRLASGMYLLRLTNLEKREVYSTRLIVE
jgi:hypothetical protein